MQFISTQRKRVGTNFTVYLGDGERVWEVEVGDSYTGRAKIPEEKLLLKQCLKTILLFPYFSEIILEAQ